MPMALSVLVSRVGLPRSYQVSVMPFDVIGLVVDSDTMTKFKILRTLRLLRLVKLVRVMKGSRCGSGFSILCVSTAIYSLNP